MAAEAVELVEGQEHCSMCIGTGEICRRCAYPEIECQCGEAFFCYTEVCHLCEGDGTQDWLKESLKKT
jgi:hypothetical protein